MSNLHSPLRLNVGFIAHQSVGYSREFSFDFPQILLRPDLRLNELSGTSRVTRTPQGLLIQLAMHATLITECVRCLSEFPLPLDIDFVDLYAFSNRHVTDSGLLLPEDGHINLEPLVREYMLLEIPISPLCKQDCKGLCLVCGENLNEMTCHHETETGDPRLAALKALLEDQ